MPSWFQYWKNSTGFVWPVLWTWECMGQLLRTDQPLGCWGWLCLLYWIGALRLSLLLKVPARKLEPWFVLWSFFLLRLLYFSINLSCGNAWNTFVMSGLQAFFQVLFYYWLAVVKTQSWIEFLLLCVFFTSYQNLQKYEITKPTICSKANYIWL